MRKLEFRYITTNDVNDLKWKWCSRAYEYPITLKFLESLNNKGISIHNTAAGHKEGLCELQFIFFDELRERGFHNIRHSDIESTPEYGIEKFNIYSDRDDNQYNVVLNISTIEHLPIEEQIPSLNNLWSNVKDGGYLVLTFDLPDVNLSMIEKWCGSKCEEKPDNALSGSNSVYYQSQYSEYNFVLLILKKDKVRYHQIY